ncbi:DUF4352 domain-containing protein [Oceanobacillus profundus]|uniref:DUF4352 domain-containing protein n=1 Tax=Oceanobacillus TaxID=182709 RepID=UPI0026E16270|nr:DUF4352 domain-containing protein [Oceanobacillus profundus]MDO6448215.1 DUF4352 domain-containing protein [Oceanobacillus profundus]
MKKLFMGLFSIALLSSLLVACNNDEQDEEVEDTPVTEEETSETPEDEATENEDEDTSEGEENNQEDDSNESASENNGEYPENQEGLGIGDTGHIGSNFGEFEITLNSVEIKDEVANDPSREGNYVLVDVTVKNLTNEPIPGADALGNTFLSTDRESTGFGWFNMDGVAEEWPEIAPGESHTGVLLYDLPVNDLYVLNTGRNFSGLSNVVAFEFTQDEAK